MKKIILIFSIFTTIFLDAQTTITANSKVFGIWKKTNSPYYIKGNISVPRDSTLTIESGVQVRFDGKYLVSVYGNIKAMGKVADSIRFYPQDTLNRWRGIRYWGRNQTKDSATFSYCKFMYAEPIRSIFENVLRMSRGNFNLNNCMFTKNKGNEYATCLVVDSALSFIMDKCYFYLNTNINTNPSKISSGIIGPVAINSGKITNCKFERNEVRNPYSSFDNHQVDGLGSGGIVYVSDLSNPNTKIEIKNCEFINNNCALKGADAQAWDEALVNYEQGQVAPPIYAGASQTAITKMNEMANGQFGTQHGFIGFVGGITPHFNWFNASITTTQARIDVPLLMMYPNTYKPKWSGFGDKVSTTGTLNARWLNIFKAYQVK